MSVELGLPPHLQHLYDDAEESEAHYHVRMIALVTARPLGEQVIWDRTAARIANAAANLIHALDAAPPDGVVLTVGKACWERQCL